MHCIYSYKLISWCLRCLTSCISFSNIFTIMKTAPPCGDCASASGEDDAELGEDWTISVSFPSNPEPTSAQWYIPALGSGTLLDAMEGADIGTNVRAAGDPITASGRYSTTPLNRNGVRLQTVPHCLTNINEQLITRIPMSSPHP